jgi:hypothetical protein
MEKLRLASIANYLEMLPDHSSLNQPNMEELGRDTHLLALIRKLR